MQDLRRFEKTILDSERSLSPDIVSQIIDKSNIDHRSTHNENYRKKTNLLVKKLSSNIRTVRRLKNKLDASNDEDELFKSDKYFDKKMMVNYANQIKRTQF